MRNNHFNKKKPSIYTHSQLAASKPVTGHQANTEHSQKQLPNL